MPCEGTHAEDGEIVAGDDFSLGGSRFVILNDLVVSCGREGKNSGEDLIFLAVGVEKLPPQKSPWGRGSRQCRSAID